MKSEAEIFETMKFERDTARRNYNHALKDANKFNDGFRYDMASSAWRRLAIIEEIANKLGIKLED